MKKLYDVKIIDLFSYNILQFTNQSFEIYEKVLNKYISHNHKQKS